MSDPEVPAPAMSTYQDATTFARYLDTEKDRAHLLLPPAYDYDAYVSEIDRFYQLDALADYVASQGFNKVTLQFPDDLICDSLTIVQRLQRRQPDIAFWVLADTSYLPCCIDEVAAEHVHADVVVHFGNACLNTTSKLPSVYNLGRPEFDVPDIAQRIAAFQHQHPDTPLVVMCDTQYTWKLDELAEACPDVTIARAWVDEASGAHILGNTHAFSPMQPHLLALNRRIDGITSVEELAASNLWYFGNPAAPRMLQLTTSFNEVAFHNPQGDLPVPSLNRRYLNMHKARLAATVGLLVNTLSLANTKHLLATIAKKIAEAGKKHYMFVVGKPNVAKLANFELVDVWCVLGCDHQGIILDEFNEYFKPIVTPYELMLALRDELSWTGKWVTEYARVLEEMEAVSDNDEEERGLDYSDEEPEFDPVTGKFVAAKPLRQRAYLAVDTASDEPAENQLVKKFASTVAIKNTVSTSAAHLQLRAWTGLGSDFQSDDYDEDGAVVEEGRGGVARGYDFDRQVNH